MSELFWLPVQPDWQERAAALSGLAAADAWASLVSLAGARLSFTETIQLDRAAQKIFGAAPPPNLATKPVRLAILSSSTSEHLVPGLRVGMMRRGLWLSAYTTAYGQYLQEMMDADSGLHRFAPSAILIALDSAHLFGNTDPAFSRKAADDALDAACQRLREIWATARKSFGAEIYQQTLLPHAAPLVGSNEHRLPGSLRQLCRRLNDRLRDMADEAGIHLVAVDDWAAQDGVSNWHDPVYWHKAKQDIRPLATPLYGDKVARLLVAAQGRSFKCLVLDLDNTLWGGVIGDDGLEGISLGQGSAVGEAFLSLQRHARDLSRRGIILAVCSKNDEVNALLPFDQHPEMVLKRADIACFVANWSDKAANLRLIAERLNIGLDALVFVDDNPFERTIVRRELPMVAVPELPEDPALYVSCLAAAGYFETLSLTEEDFVRASQYQANIERETLKASATDLASYLKSLGMELHVGPFDRIGLSRIVQLINKTNQFNLTTRRYAEAEITALLDDRKALTLQMRLTDQFGDNGIIGIVIGRAQTNGDLVIDTWLMSCRVLGRGVEAATLNLIADGAKRLGCQRLVGDYLPTAKNGMVADHYRKLGFEQIQMGQAQESTRWALPLERFTANDTFISIRKAA